MFMPPRLDDHERQVRAEIEKLAQQLRLHIRSGNRWTGALRRSTFARNVQGSNSIEGILATVDDVGAIAAGETPATVDHETELAVQGYQLAMTFVLQLAKGEFDLDSSLLRSLHFMTTSYDMTKWPGRYRQGPVYVEESATGDIVHEGAPSEGLTELVKSFASSAFESEDPLIAAAMAHLNLVLIHPFKDGNGRMARIVQSLALSHESDIAPVFMGIEEYLGRRTSAYYDVLAEVGQGNYSNADYDPELARPWIRFMLTAHYNQALEIDHRIGSAGRAAQSMDELAEKHSLPERSTQALYGAMFGDTVTRARYMVSLEESGEPISEQTASRDLAALARAGLLIAHGDKRGRRYTPSDIVRMAAREAGLGYKWKDLEPFAKGLKQYS